MKTGKVVLIIILLIFQTGCWDENLLKDNALVLSIGFDLAENTQVKTTSSIRTSKIISGGQAESVNYIVEEKGPTLRDTRL
ncbi:MAG: hypothetical protein ACXVHR_10665, partial [Methanobacterium sp.]